MFSAILKQTDGGNYDRAVAEADRRTTKMMKGKNVTNKGNNGNMGKYHFLKGEKYDERVKKEKGELRGKER